MDESDMAFDGHACAHTSCNPDFSTLEYDFEGLNAILGHDPSLTQGLDTLGNCNSDDTSCFDQRCLSHLSNSDMGYTSSYRQQYDSASSMSPMPGLQTPNLHATNFDTSTLHSMTFQQPSLLNHSHCFNNANDIQQNHHHVNGNADPWMTPCSLASHLPWEVFLPNNGHITSSFGATPFGIQYNNSHQQQSNYGDCFPDCNSQCTVACASQCGEDTCCYDDSCVQGTQSVCCWGDLCDSGEVCEEPCMDEACQAAVNPCTDANCTGIGTVSTTPVSASAKTPPSLESDPLIQTITSPSDLTANTDAIFKTPSFLPLKRRNDSTTAHYQRIKTSIKSRSVSVASTTKETITSSSSEQHIIGPDNLFMCRWVLANGGICGQRLENNEQLQNHCKNMHLGDLAKVEGGYECGWHGCTRKGNFTQKSKLERHMQTHTGFKPVKCNICGVSLSAKQSLDQHLRIHSGEKPWKCQHPGCNQAFKQQSALTMHERTHTGEKPLSCDICGKKFGESSNLSKHRRIHNQKGNFLCMVCGKDFHRQDQLRRHMNTNHRGVQAQSGSQTKATPTPTPTPQPTPHVDSPTIELIGIKDEALTPSLVL